MNLYYAALIVTYLLPTVVGVGLGYTLGLGRGEDRGYRDGYRDGDFDADLRHQGERYARLIKPEDEDG